ncbi:MAG: tetratricopeptide repeat protein, partial [Rhodanobacteraceae bacterium]
LLSKSEFDRTDELWGRLKQTYGDKVALRRAKAQWAWVKTHQTGTRVGGTVGELFVGAYDTGGSPVEAGKSGSGQMFAAGFGYMQGGSLDGSVAYRQFQQSSNPYDPVFLKNRTGTVSVEPLQLVKPANDKAKKNGQGTGGVDQPGQPLRSA